MWKVIRQLQISYKWTADQKQLHKKGVDIFFSLQKKSHIFYKLFFYWKSFVYI